jgi:dolichol-phosphate hexosyltransferase
MASPTTTKSMRRIARACALVLGRRTGAADLRSRLQLRAARAGLCRVRLASGTILSGRTRSGIGSRPRLTQCPLAAWHTGGAVPTLSILMPVYNERATVEQAIADVMSASLPIPHELIVVDDGSDDGTEQILASGDWPAGVSVLRHEINQGKGSAVRTALDHAQGELVGIFDADLEYRATDLAMLLPPLLEGETSVVFGVRAFEGHTSHSLLYVMGNRAMTICANVLFNVYLTDIMTCHKVLRTELLRSLRLRCRGFDIEPEIVARVLQRGHRIYEVPISYRARRTEEGKKLTARDGIGVVGTLVRCRLTGGTG